MKYVSIFLITVSFSVHADWYTDYVYGVTDVEQMLADNPDVIESVGPLSSNYYTNNYTIGGINFMDYGYGVYPNLTGSVGVDETQFLSFQFTPGNIFSDIYLHFVVAMRGHSNTPNFLRGRGLAIGNTPGCTNGLQIEDFTASAVGGGYGSYLKGCKNLFWQSGRKFRIDMEASIFSVSYKIYRLNTTYEQNAYNLNKWSIYSYGECGNPPFAACYQHPDDVGGQNIVIGTAGRTKFNSFVASNIYVAKWPN